MRVLAAVAAVFIAPTPAPPSICGPTGATDTVIEDNPVLFVDDNDPGRAIVDGKAVYTFTTVVECPEELPPPAVEELAPLPAPIEPGYDEFDPVGPSEGPPGAVTVDKP